MWSSRQYEMQLPTVWGFDILRLIACMKTRSLTYDGDLDAHLSLRLPLLSPDWEPWNCTRACRVREEVLRSDAPSPEAFPQQTTTAAAGTSLQGVS
jgi:hypothetical protein